MIHAYYNGQLISEGDLSNPLVIGPLNASDNEVSAPIAIELKCEAGYKTLGNTIVSFEGATNTKWSISRTEGGSYTSQLSIPDEITSTGLTVFVKAKATSDEMPINDTRVSIKIATVIQAV